MTNSRNLYVCVCVCVYPPVNVLPMACNTYKQTMTAEKSFFFYPALGFGPSVSHDDQRTIRNRK